MTLESVLQKEKKSERQSRGCLCVCVFPSDVAILIIMLTALMSLCRCVPCVFFLPLFPAAVRSDPITFGHVEFNSGSVWAIIFSSCNPRCDYTLSQYPQSKDL